MFRCWSPAQRVVTGWFACIWHLTKSAWCDLPRHRCAAFIRTVFPISCIFLHVMQSIQSTEVYKEKAAYLATFKAEKHRQMLSDIHTTRYVELYKLQHSCCFLVKRIHTRLKWYLSILAIFSKIKYHSTFAQNWQEPKEKKPTHLAVYIISFIRPGAKGRVSSLDNTYYLIPSDNSVTA